MNTGIHGQSLSSLYGSSNHLGGILEHDDASWFPVSTVWLCKSTMILMAHR